MAAQVSNDIDTILNGINADAARSQQQIFEKFKKEIEDVKASNPDGNFDEDALFTKLRLKGEELKTESDMAIDDSFDKAKSRLMDIPPESRDAAAKTFSAGADTVANVAAFVFGTIKELTGSVADFGRGVWDQLETSDNDVETSVANAVQAINSNGQT
ncbi:hypothetical protein P7C71_g4790, partial [Lecanoromycetidae sp. Uapishka_2]